MQWLESGIAMGMDLGTGAGLAPGDGSKEKQASPCPHESPASLNIYSHLTSLKKISLNSKYTMFCY